MENTYTCPHCGASITENTIVCTYCGCQVKNVVKESQPAPQIIINNISQNVNTNQIIGATPVVVAKGKKQARK